MVFSQKVKTLLGSVFIIASLIAVSIFTSHAQDAGNGTGTGTDTPTNGTGTGTGTEDPTDGTASCNNSDECLRAIMNNTYAVLRRVNKLPTYLDKITETALAWMTPAKDDTTANLQANFTNFSNAFLTDLAGQNSLQPQVLQVLFNAANSTDFPDANDYAYQTLLDLPYFARDPRKKSEDDKGPDSKFNYITFAAGLQIPHAKPDKSFNGNPDDYKRYEQFFRTALAVESFNAYVLSAAYADSVQGQLFNNLQTTLITQASDPEWFKQVGGESIGIVLRQILLYQSQTFVLLSQLLQTQKQALIAQALTSTSIFAAGSADEATLLRNARVAQPG